MNSRTKPPLKPAEQEASAKGSRRFWPGRGAKVVIADLLAAEARQTAEKIGYAVAFLASDEADFITGQVLSVSGGLTMV